MKGPRLVARVPHPAEADGANWLVIQHDVDDSKGWFLFYHRDLDGPYDWDYWYPNLAEAMEHAVELGIKHEDWQDG